MHYLKICFLILFIFIIQPAMSPSAFAADVIPVSQPGEVESTLYHQFVIIAASPIDFYPSDSKTINITIQNVFNYSAFSVSTVVDKDKADPLKFTKQLQIYAGNEIGPKQRFTVQYEISIKDNVPKGTYYIPLSVIWSAVADGTVKKQEDLFIGIQVAENPEIIKIDTLNVTTIPEHVKAGDTFKLKVAIKNIGNNKLNQIRSVLDVKLPFSSIGSSTEQYIPLLESGQSAEIQFNLQVDKSSPSRLYNFNFTLEYKDYTNRLQSQQSTLGINVEETSEAYIQDITLDPTTLNPDSDGLLMVQIANAGTNEIKNVRVTVFGGEKILTQTQNFIGIIQPGPKSSETTSFGVHVDPEMDAGEYGLNIQINYDDVNGVHNSKSGLYIVKVSEKSSIIPVSNDRLNDIIYAFIFVVMSYGIFLVVGFQTDKKK